MVRDNYTIPLSCNERIKLSITPNQDSSWHYSLHLYKNAEALASLIFTTISIGKHASSFSGECVDNFSNRYQEIRRALFQANVANAHRMTIQRTIEHLSSHQSQDTLEEGDGPRRHILERYPERPIPVRHLSHK